MAANIITIIMASVLIYETSGPIFAKLAIGLAGEINGQDVPTPRRGYQEVPVKALAKEVIPHVSHCLSY
ncbi:MAG: hypothetical protein MZU97_17330 [Bacillus subtilis]|nr:hypothetical protein [Bacillus subtilis]